MDERAKLEAEVREIERFLASEWLPTPERYLEIERRGAILRRIAELPS